MRLTIFILLANALFAQSEYDLLLKGARVIDPKNKISSVLDVAIRDGHIAAVARDIPARQAHKTVDVSGLYLVPGLIDLHAHVFAGSDGIGLAGGETSIYPDTFALRAGVTTVVDAGSSGRRNFARFKQTVIDRARTRVLAFLNIGGVGMPGDADEQNVADMDAKAAAEVAIANRDTIVGIKVAHYRGPDWTPVERGVEAGTAANIPVMVDFGEFRPERPFQELVLKKLRPGDIYTHAFYAPVPMLDEQGRLLPYLFEARRRGIIFDVGHGGAAFEFRQAVPAVRQGFPPDSISTDVHSGSINAGMKDQLNVMSKFLNMGMPLDDVVARSTWNPARIIHREQLGHLSVGALADIAVLRLEKGQFAFVDSWGARMDGTQRLVGELTVASGRVVWDLNGRTRESWDRLGKYQPQGDPRWDGTRGGGRPRALTPVAPPAKPAQAAKPAQPEFRFVSLMPKNDVAELWTIEGTPPESWSVRDGVIACTGKPNGFLRSKKSYRNYIFRAEWRFQKEGWTGAPQKWPNAGFFIHAGEVSETWPKSFEVQGHYGEAGSLFGVRGGKIRGARRGPIVKDRPPLGEWDRYEIVSINGTVTVVLNGKVVNAGVGAEPSQGNICLQSEGWPVFYRNLEIMELPE